MAEEDQLSLFMLSVLLAVLGLVEECGSEQLLAAPVPLHLALLQPTALVQQEQCTATEQAQQEGDGL